MFADISNNVDLPNDGIFCAFDSDPFRVFKNSGSTRIWILASSKTLATLRVRGTHVFRFEASALGGLEAVDLNSQGQVPISMELLIDPAIWDADEALINKLDDPVVQELALAVLTAFRSSRPSDYTLHCIIKMLCARLKEMQQDDALRSDCRFEDWQLSVLRKALHGDIGEYVQLSDVAGKCRLSVCHFSRLFKATYGMPLHRYLVNSRIKHAKSRLLETRDAISQIALDCGFADQSSFTRRFTAVAGVPPAIWRRSGHSSVLNHSDSACRKRQAQVGAIS